MKAIFLSDTHLLRPSDPNYRALIGFIKELHASRVRGIEDHESIWADELFLVGDIFEFWFAKGGNIYPPFQEVVANLADLKEAGVGIHFCEGNHDFFLKDYFTSHLGMTVYPEWAELELDGRKILLSHGDTLDKHNKRYLIWRRFLRSVFFYRLQCLLPLSLLWKLADVASRTSRNLAMATPEELSDKLHSHAREILAGKDYSMIIMGHSHQPLLREHIIGGKQIRYSVTLGDWINYRSYLYFENGDFRLCYYSGAGQE